MLHRRIAGPVLGVVCTVAAMAASPASAAEVLQPVAFSKMALKLPPGQVYARIGQGIFCGASKSMIWNGGVSPMKIALFQDSFRSEMTKSGFNVPGDPTNVFDTTPADASDLALAALVTDENIDICQPGAASGGAKGTVRMGITWELFSHVQNRILATISTTGQGAQTDASAGALPKLMVAAFAANVDQLAADPALRRALSGPAATAGAVVADAGETSIELKAPEAVVPIDQARGSVVVIFTGSGSGSGVLVSADGYVLTDAHVVGDAQEVRLKWSDGLESVGHVVRVAKGRDVALIKTDGRGRTPLRLRRTPLTLGETVFALGAPLGERFSGTVTRGVVSATERLVEGFSYVQSDVSVAPGNSGGPLVDEQGRVVALTVAQVRMGGAPVGIGLFIPARDAADFLNLSVR